MSARQPEIRAATVGSSGRNDCQELEHAVVYADPEHPKHAQWVTCPVSMLAMQELRCFQLPGIVYRSLQHWAMHSHAAT